MRSLNQSRPVIFGEVLFDCFPDGSRVLGGAPFNVSWHLQAFGLAPLLISAVGSDENGKALLACMDDWGMDTSGIQTSSDHPTGTVQVTVTNGEPAYDISHPVAWDFIDAGALPSLPQYTLLYYGSLAIREKDSATALLCLKARADTYSYCDINIRKPYWSPQQRSICLDSVDVLKLNKDECASLRSQSRQAADDEAVMAGLMREHGLDRLILTRGDLGAIAMDAPVLAPETVRPGRVSRVVDTVGAGDAFSSVCILGMCRGWPLQLTLQRAQDFACKVVGIRGATIADRNFYDPLIAQWRE